MTGRTARKGSWGGVAAAVIGVVAAVVGGLVGLIAAVIVSVNFVITVVGHPDGYEASPVEVFQYSPIGGVVNLVILVGGPVLGAWLGWMIGRRATR